MTATYFTSVPLMALLAAACIADVKARRIPNALTLGGAALAFVLHVYASGPTGFALALAGWIVALGCFLPLYMIRAMAAGDVKLMAMVGAFIGPLPAVLACVCALLAGGVLGAIFLSLQQIRPYDDPSTAEPIASGHAPTSARTAASRLAEVPYGIAIAAGAAFVVLAPQMVERIIPMGIQ